MGNTAPAVFDHHIMGIANAMARRGLGTTAPNPSVGAVIANESTGDVIARAVTAPGGRPHAEPLAIALAGERCRGATLYVTLEPCAHFGRTPPCVDAIIASGIARVVVAQTDPDPRVAGRGLERLRAAGIAVTRGVRTAEAHAVTLGHITRVAERRPAVTLKMALGEDGEVPRGINGTPRWVTGPEATAYAHVLRATHDAILVGAQTVRDDNPDLTCRLPGLADRSPLRVVLAGRTTIEPSCRLAQSAKRVPVLLYEPNNSSSGHHAALAEKGVDIASLHHIHGRVWLPAVLEDLAGRGITRLLVEGGSRVWSAFAAHGFADEIIVAAAGDGALPEPDAIARARALVLRYLNLTRLTVVEVRRAGKDAITLFSRAAVTPPPTVG